MEALIYPWPAIYALDHGDKHKNINGTVVVPQRFLASSKVNDQRSYERDDNICNINTRKYDQKVVTVYLPKAKLMLPSLIARCLPE
jgi:hypothetical protein